MKNILRTWLVAILAMTLCFSLTPSAAFALDNNQGNRGVGGNEVETGPLAESLSESPSADGGEPAPIAETTVEAASPLGSDTPIVNDAIGAEPETGAGSYECEPWNDLGRIDTSSGFSGISLFSLNNEAADKVGLAESLMREAIASYLTELTDLQGHDITVAEAKQAFYRIVDDPSLFYVSNSLSFSYFQDAEAMDDCTVVSLRLGYVVDQEELPAYTARFEEAVAAALSWTGESMTDVEKAQALHDYLVRMCAYDEEGLNSGNITRGSYSAYGALVNGLAVCQGYAGAYKLLLQRVGIPCVTTSSDAMNHMWNMVQIDGVWYHVDATWDDPVPDGGFDRPVEHSHFLKSDVTMTALNHYDWVAQYTAPSDYPLSSYPEYVGPYDPTGPAPSEGWTQFGTCEWQIKDGCLTIRPLNDGAEGVLGEFISSSPAVRDGAPWFLYRKMITSAVIEPNVKAAGSLAGMFYECDALKKIDVSNFDTSDTKDMGGMFRLCISLESIDVSSFDTANVIDFGGMFSACRSLETIDVSHFDTGNAQNMGAMFYECESLASLDVSNFETKHVTDMSNMFCGCNALKDLDVSQFDTSQVVTIYNMFAACNNLQTLDVSGFNTSNVSGPNGMNGLFSGCSSIEALDVSNFCTERVNDMTAMFAECRLLKTLDVSNFKTENVEYMAAMFSNCSSLTSLDLTSFKTPNLKESHRMFEYCTSLREIIFPYFDISQVKDLSEMFNNCISLSSIDLRHLVTSSATSMRRMFEGCASVSAFDISNFDFSNIVDLSYIFFGCTKLTEVPTGFSFGPNPGELLKEHCFFSNSFVNTFYSGNEREILEYDWASDNRVLVTNGWNVIDGITWYYENGTLAKGERLIDGAWYHFDEETGGMSTGVTTLPDGRVVYYDPQCGKMTKGEVLLDDGWHYFDWLSGEMAIGVVEMPAHDGRTLYFDGRGVMQKGEVLMDEGWRYFDFYTGDMAVGVTRMPDGRTLYYDEAGVMRKGEVLLDGGWRYFDWVTGDMAIGITTMPEGDGRVLYYDESGIMMKGEVLLSDGWHFFDFLTGEMRTGIVEMPVHDGRTLYFDEAGVMRKGEVLLSDGWHYFDWVTGSMAVGITEMPDGRTVYYDAAGVMQKGWVVVDGTLHHFDELTGDMLN